MLSFPRARVWAAVFVLAGFVSVGCGGGDDSSALPIPGGGLEVPAAWAGIWSIQTIMRDCDTHEVLSDTTEADTLCAGDDVSSFEDDAAGATCAGTVTDTAIDVTCTSTFAFNYVTFSATFTLDATRTGDSFQGSGRATVTQAGFVVECFDVELLATRTGAAPADCDGTPATLLPRLRAEVLDWAPTR